MLAVGKVFFQVECRAQCHAEFGQNPMLITSGIFHLALHLTSFFPQNKLELLVSQGARGRVDAAHSVSKVRVHQRRTRAYVILRLELLASQASIDTTIPQKYETEPGAIVSNGTTLYLHVRFQMFGG